MCTGVCTLHLTEIRKVPPQLFPFRNLIRLFVTISCDKSEYPSQQLVVRTSLNGLSNLTESGYIRLLIPLTLNPPSLGGPQGRGGLRIGEPKKSKNFAPKARNFLDFFWLKRPKIMFSRAAGARNFLGFLGPKSQILNPPLLLIPPFPEGQNRGRGD